MPLQKNLPIPLYYQLAEQLREEIEAGRFKPGEAIPSVAELSAAYRISAMTVRQTIGVLAQQGLVEVRRGIGTYVVAPKITYPLSYLSGFSEDMRSLALPTHGKIIGVTLQPASDSVARRLAIAPGDKVVQIVRLRYADNTPILLDEQNLASALCPGLEMDDLEHNSLYEILEGRYRYTLARATETIEATGANAFESEQLGLPVGGHIILIRGVTSLADGRPIEYFKLAYPGDRVRFQLETVRQRKG